MCIVHMYLWSPYQSQVLAVLGSLPTPSIFKTTFSNVSSGYLGIPAADLDQHVNGEHTVSEYVSANGEMTTRGNTDVLVRHGAGYQGRLPVQGIPSWYLRMPIPTYLGFLSIGEEG